MRQNIQAIIFDMDGTMVDNMAVHTRTWISFFAERGIELEPRIFHDRTAGRTTPEILRMFLGEDLSSEQVYALGEEKEVRYRDFFRKHARPVTGLIDLLHAARGAGYKLGIATAAPPENVAITLECLGLSNFFDAIVNGAEVRNGKPDPELFLTAAARLAVDPQACLVFEDAPMGVEAARRAGMQAVVVTTTLSADEGRQLSGVIHTVSDFTESLALI